MVLNNLPLKIQIKINSYIPEKIHKAITAIIKQMICGVLFGAKFTSYKKLRIPDLSATGIFVKKKIDIYRKIAAVEGVIIGAGSLNNDWK